MIKKNSSSFAFLDQFVVSGGNFITIIILARYFDQNTVGIYGYLFAFSVLTYVVNSALIYHPLTVLEKNTEDKWKLYKSVFLFHLAVAIVLSFIVQIGLAFLIDAGYQEYSFAIFLYFVMQQVADFSRKTAYIFFSSRRAFFVSMSVFPTRVLLLFFLDWNLDSFYFSLIISVIIPSVYQAILMLSVRAKASVIEVCQVLAESRWLVASVPLAWGWGYIPIFVLGQIYSLHEVGVLAALRSVTNIGNVFLEVLETKGAILYAQFHHSSHLTIEAIHKKIRMFLFIVWGVLFIGFSIFGDVLLVALYSGEYSKYHFTLILLWLMQGFVFSFRAQNVFIRTQKESRRIMNGYFVGFCAVLLSCYPLVNLWSVNGAATTLLVGALFIMIGQKKIRR